MRRDRFQWLIPHCYLSCFLWNMVARLLYIFSANTLDTSAFRIQPVKNSDNCQDHTIHFIQTFALIGEPVVLNCPPFRYKSMDASGLLFNLSWYKNGSTEMISSESTGNRIWSNKDALWFLPASLEDSGEYICMRRNSTYCSDVSLHLTIVEKSAVQAISYPQKATLLSSGHLVCPLLEDFIQNNTEYELKWYKDSILLKIDNKKFKMRRGTNYLTIPSVSMDDSGFYTCQMTFKYETMKYNITRTIQLQILGQKKKSRPVIVYPNQNITLAVLDSRLTIPCKVFVGANSHTFTDVWWLANKSYIDVVYKNKRVTEGKPQKFVENGDSYIEVPLIFDPVKKVDFNTDFTCVAQNRIGHQVQATHVKQEEHSFSWYMAVIPAALATVIMGGVCAFTCWRKRSFRGYVPAPVQS
ncbi:interleukin-1 receptor type 2 [Anolis carolinensis]|uniref:Interleukin 1 receptor type 2 n=1 Tax=Anolis carolinensis TaxID=28377 RepID=H9GCQ6_ANOCA|nr:PREDICTED: interleukin-1 receptor type 2 [Anolis carolinensis]|eukprot:XP_003224339.2 PREDICTED: interleukin-1 receptor type 2 [Anolis carolinensis]